MMLIMSFASSSTEASRYAASCFLGYVLDLRLYSDASDRLHTRCMSAGWNGNATSICRETFVKLICCCCHTQHTACARLLTPSGVALELVVGAIAVRHKWCTMTLRMSE